MAREYPLRTNSNAGRRYTHKITFDGSGDPSAVVPATGVCTHLGTPNGKYKLEFSPSLPSFQNARINIVKDANSSTVTGFIRSVANSAGKTVVTFQTQSAAGTDAKLVSATAIIEVELCRSFE